MSEIDYQAVQDYLVSLVPPREPEVQKMEEYAEINDFPIIGIWLFHGVVRQSDKGKWRRRGAPYCLG